MEIIDEIKGALNGGGGAFKMCSLSMSKLVGGEANFSQLCFNLG